MVGYVAITNKPWNPTGLNSSNSEEGVCIFLSITRCGSGISPMSLFQIVRSESQAASIYQLHRDGLAKDGEERARSHDKVLLIVKAR